MFEEKPHLQFICSQYMTDEDVVCSVVAQFVNATAGLAHMFDHSRVGVEQTCNLSRHFFAPPGRPRDRRSFSDVMRHGETHAAEGLNPFSHEVRQPGLFFVMLIKQEMKLIEGGP